MTRVPVGGFPYSKEEWRWSSAWFPFVGFALGIAAAGVWSALAAAGPWVASIGALTATVLLTGAFHEDGLADSADALGGAYDREKLFVILKDSRVGAFGALALVLTIVFRLCLLAELDTRAPVALVAGHTLARLGPVWLMVAMPYVTDAEAKSRLVTRASAPQGLLATALTVVCLIGLTAWSPGLAVPLCGAFLAMAGATLFCGWRFRVRAGGVTGDFLGASEQVNEVVVLLLLLLLMT